MTYDLSDNEQYHESLTPENCPLDKQVEFYMNTWKTASIPANTGFKIGTPEYSDPKHDVSHQLPLTIAQVGQWQSNSHTSCASNI